MANNTTDTASNLPLFLLLRTSLDLIRGIAPNNGRTVGPLCRTFFLIETHLQSLLGCLLLDVSRTQPLLLGFVRTLAIDPESQDVSLACSRNTTELIKGRIGDHLLLGRRGLLLRCLGLHGTEGVDKLLGRPAVQRVVQLREVIAVKVPQCVLHPLTGLLNCDLLCRCHLRVKSKRRVSIKCPKELSVC